MAPRAPREASPPRRLERYTLVEKLGAGGMAEVWIARQDGAAGAQRPVVVKLVKPDVDGDETRTMFLDEARTSMLLGHPNVVQVFDVGFDAGAETYFIAMELIMGEHLGRVLSRLRTSGRSMPLPIALRIVAEVCRGLHHAHEYRGPDEKPLEIVHRDVSPQNIMVSFDGHVKVVDFGIATAKHRRTETATGIVKGKSRYMSPEQARARPVDRRTDVFALGAVLHEVATGKRLFDADNDLAVLGKILSGRIPPPSELAPEVPVELDRIVMRALERRLDRRTPSADALKDEIEALVAARGWVVTTEALGRFMQELLPDKHEAVRAARRRAFAAEDVRAPQQGGGVEAVESPLTDGTPDVWASTAGGSLSGAPARAEQTRLRRALAAGAVVLTLAAIASVGALVLIPDRKTSSTESNAPVASPNGDAHRPASASVDGAAGAADPNEPRDVVLPPAEGKAIAAPASERDAGEAPLAGEPVMIPSVRTHPPDAGAREGAAPRGRAKAPEGWVRIKVFSLTNPDEPVDGVRVWIDGKPRSKMDAGRFRAPAGVRRIRIEARGLHDEKPVEVKANEVITVRFTIDG